MAKKTAEEKYLIKLYEMANNAGDIYSEVDMFLVGKQVGIKEKTVKILIRNLAQTNFIKKSENDLVYLTPNGLSLIIDLQSTN